MISALPCMQPLSSAAASQWYKRPQVFQGVWTKVKNIRIGVVTCHSKLQKNRPPGSLRADVNRGLQSGYFCQVALGLTKGSPCARVKYSRSVVRGRLVKNQKNITCQSRTLISTHIANLYGSVVQMAGKYQQLPFLDKDNRLVGVERIPFHNHRALPVG